MSKARAMFVIICVLALLVFLPMNASANTNDTCANCSLPPMGVVVDNYTSWGRPISGVPVESLFEITKIYVDTGEFNAFSNDTMKHMTVTLGIVNPDNDGFGTVMIDANGGKANATFFLGGNNSDYFSFYYDLD